MTIQVDDNSSRRQFIHRNKVKYFSSLHNEVAVGSKQDKHKPDVKDQKLLTFEVCAANRFKLHKKFREIQSKIEENPHNVSLRSQLHQSQQAAKAEAEDNDLEQKRQQGRKLLYGQIIQLKHRFTLKYIHVSTSTTSPTEGKNMAVTLQHYNAKHAQFRVMPRYKVKAEGDVVQVDDQIVFESVKSPGHYLHVSKALLDGTSVYNKCYELNLSVEQSGFTVYRNYKPRPEDEKKVKMGNLVRFYHKEMEAYLVAEGLFDYELTEDVHLRLRPTDQSNPKSMIPSSSAITFWQIELQEGCVEGGVLKWEQQCRLLHMCTRQYLCLGENGEVTLTSNHLDPKAVFRLHPVIRESDDIPEDSYCRIEHVVTEQWLHASRETYTRNQEKSLETDSKSMGSLKWSTAQMRKITVVQEQQYDDAFTIQAVDPALENIFSYMAGMVPFIHKLVRDKKDGVVLNAKMSHGAITAFKEIKEFMVLNGEPIKQRQKLMRNLRIVELLVNLLKCPFSGPDQYHMTRVFRAVYEVLHTYLLGRSRKNKLYVARYIDFFLTQFKIKEGDIGLSAVHMVMESIRDNRKIVDRITHDHIDVFVELLLLEKNYRYLDLLSVLCVCAGVAIADNQNRITEAWLVTNGMKCVFHTKLETNQRTNKENVYVSTDNGRTWIDLVTLANRDTDGTDYLFLEHQLKLFGYLSNGQNQNAISVITRDYLTWEVAFKSLCDERIPEQTRALCCDLIISLFVDTAENYSVVDRVKLCYVFDDITDDQESKIHAGNAQSLTYKYFPQLSKWISEFLGKNTEMTASNKGNNVLIKQVLKLVHFLVAFGFYGNYEDIKKLLDPLMSLLDGRYDKPYPNIEGKEGQEFLAVFRQSERFKPSPETKAIVEAKLEALGVLDLFLNFRFNNRLERFIYLFKIVHFQMNKPGGTSDLAPLLSQHFNLEENMGVAKRGKKRLTDIFETTAFMRQYNIVDILLDLSHYEYDSIVRRAMHLLNRWFSAYQNLFKRAVLTQVLITDNSVKFYQRAEQLVPELRRMAALRMGDTEATKVTEILKELISFCHLPGEEEEHHPMNQSILYNVGIMEVMITLLSKEIDEKMLDHYAGLREVFEVSFVLLKLLARNNQVVQQRLFDRLDLLLIKKGGFKQMAELVAEIFTGNSKTCMKITEDQVQKIMSLVAKHRSNVPQFIGILTSVVKVDELDLPLKRNQSIVMTNFMQYSSEVAPIIHEDQSARMKLLMSTDANELNFFISVVDLLATCAEGENRFIESICQTIFKIPELFTVLNNSLVNDRLKRPYLTFILGVYLNTMNGMIESGAGDIPHDPSTWTFLDTLSVKLVDVTDYVRNNPETVKQLLKKAPCKSSIDGDPVEDMRGSLHYLFDAVMPFIQVFCRTYYEIDKENYADEPVKMKILAESFKAFFEVIVTLVSVEKQMQRLITSMSLLFSTNALDKDDLAAFQERYGQGVGSQDVRSEARKSYDEDYSGEEDIGRQLHVFVVNMKDAYGGMNDVQTQIGFPSKRAYSEIGGDEELPLSEEFQAHINVFIDHNAKSSLDKYKLSQKLVKQLSISKTLHALREKERIEQLELDLKCMKLLRGIVHNEIIRLPVNYEYDLQSFNKQLKVIEDVQNSLSHYGCIAGTLEHLARPEDDIVRELLAFLVALLFNGNQSVQGRLYEFFTGTREETFFLAIKQRIDLSTIATREKRILQALRQAKIDETIAQVKSLRKAMKNDSLVDMAVASITRSLMTSMTSMQRSMTALPGAHTSRRQSSTSMHRSAMGSRLTNGGVHHGLYRNGGTAEQVPSGGVQAQTVQTSNTSVRNGIMSGHNRVAPSPSHVQVEVTDEEEITQMMQAQGMPEFEFRDDGCIELVLRILGVMCDNQHTGLQNYIREQSDNIKSINLVAETIKFLNIMYTNINADTISLVTEIFETLVEFTTGNHTNQSVVFDNKICDYINHILRSDVYKDCSDQQVYTLKKAIGYLLRNLTEENPSSETKQAHLPKEVLEFLDTGVIVTVMTEARGRQTVKTLGNSVDCFTLLAETVGFQYYHLLARKLDLDPNLDYHSILKTEDDEVAFQYYSEHSLSVEIVKHGVIQKLHFQVKDKKVLREEIKEKFKYEVDRSSPSNKIRGFMDWAKDIIKDIKYQRQVHANPIGRLLVNAWLPLNYSAMVVTLMICIFVMVTWKEGDSGSPRYKPSFRFNNSDIVIYVFGGIHNFLSLCIFFSYIISNRPTFPSVTSITRRWRRGKDDSIVVDSWIKKTEGSNLEMKAYGFKTIYYVLFVGCSLAGTVTDGYFFAFHLLHISELNQLLKRVIKAVTTNGQSLMLVALLGLAIFYIYSLILFAFYRDWMWSATDGRHCRTIYECFVSVLHHGLVEGPYTHFQQHMGDDFPQAIGITFFDVSFFIIITTIGLNIIFGIIVDTFSQLRDSKWEIDKDMQTTCFICSRESYDFEKHGGGEGFQRHVKEEHYLWAYLFFFIHLDETRPNDYSAMELYVYRLLLVKNYDFFPLGRALSLENEEDTKEIKLDYLQHQVDFVVTRLKEQEAEIVREKEKQRQQKWERAYKRNKDKK